MTSTLRTGANAQTVDTLTRLLIGLLRQQDADANKGKPRTTEVESVRYPSNRLAPVMDTTTRAIQGGRAIVREEFLRDEDAAKYSLKWSVLVDDLPDLSKIGPSGKRGDVEITVHPIDPSRFQEIVKERV